MNPVIPAVSYLNEWRRGRQALLALREIGAQVIQEGAAAGPSIILIQLHALEKHECAENFGVANRRSAFFGELLAQGFDSFLHALMNSGGDEIRGPRFIVQTALERAIGADERLQRFADIGSAGPRRGK